MSNHIAVDGVSFGQYNMGTTALNTGYHIQALSEEQPPNNNQFVVPSVSFPIAIQGMVGGKWVNASSAIAFNSGGTWGLSANGDSITFGGKASPSTGTSLWSKSSTTTTTTIASTTTTIPTSTTTTTTTTVTTTLPPTSTTAYTYVNVCPDINYNYGTLIFTTGCTLSSTASATTSIATSSSSSSSTVSGVVCTSQTTGIPGNKFAVGQSVHYIGNNPSISTASLTVKAIYCGNQANMYGPPYTGNGWSYWLGSGYFAEDMLASG